MLLHQNISINVKLQLSFPVYPESRLVNCDARGLLRSFARQGSARQRRCQEIDASLRQQERMSPTTEKDKAMERVIDTIRR